MKDNRVGENALERAVRLLGRVNERFADANDEGTRRIELRVGPEGSGDLFYPEGEVLFEFASVENLTDFLEASGAAQVKMVAGQRK